MPVDHSHHRCWKMDCPPLVLESDTTAGYWSLNANFAASIRALDKKGLFKTLAEPNLW